MSIKLPPLPAIRDWPHSREELRARDLEVARLVLDAAAKVAGRVAAQYVGNGNGHSAERAANAIRKMEVRHHE